MMFAFWFSSMISVTSAQKMPESAQGPSVSSKFLEGNPADYAGTPAIGSSMLNTRQIGS
jgi:hypothetical protein